MTSGLSRQGDFREAPPAMGGSPAEPAAARADAEHVIDAASPGALTSWRSVFRQGTLFAHREDDERRISRY